MTAQRQDSVTDQLRDVVRLADQAGCYDAADWIRSQLEMRTVGSDWPCEHVDEADYAGGRGVVECVVCGCTPAS